MSGSSFGEIDTERFTRTGVAIISHVLDDSVCDAVTHILDPLLASSGARRPGARRVLQREPRVVELLAETPVPLLLGLLAGPGCRFVRAILFDKTPETNWLVPWHQDPTIAVKDRVDVPGFGPWNCKDGQHHCQPPVPVLDSITVLRLHLDPCPPASGPLRVVPGSHARGILAPDDLDSVVATGPILDCTTPRGGAVLLRPLTVHSSAKAEPESGRRRVLHLECSAQDLSGGLEWAEGVSMPRS